MQLLTELKRRNVFRVAAAYAVTAWLVLQVADILLNNFGAPDWVFRALAILFLIGFPFTLVFSWAFEITPEGIKREQEVLPEQSISPVTGRRLDQVTIVMVVLALVVLAADRLWLERKGAGVYAGDAAAMSPADAESAAARDFSIAVLPFTDMSPEGDQEYFADGLSEEILNLLAGIHELKVTGRTSSFSFKGKDTPIPEIGRTLGVAHVLEGSVRKAGDDLRITAQLIKADDGFHLWSQSYDRRLENVFAIQTEIAKAIADALRVGLVGPDTTAPIAHAAESIPAYELFLQARRLIQGRTPAGLESARELLDEALRLDPYYAPSYAAAAQAVLLLAARSSAYGDIPLEQAVAQAQPLIDRALALDPQLAAAYAVQGLLFNMDYQTSRGNDALTRALELNPSHSDALNWRAVNLGTAGRLRDRVAAEKQLISIDPLSLAGPVNLSNSLMLSGEAAEADAVARRVQRNYSDLPFGFSRQAEALLSIGRLAEARTAADKALALGPDNRFVQGSIGRVYYALGDHDQVLALPRAYEQGLALLTLGQVDEALTAARARSAAEPDNYYAAGRLLRTLSLGGRHDEVLTVYRERWEDLEGLAAVVGFDLWTGELEPIAASQHALGHSEALAETLKYWGERLAFLREEGFAHSEFRFLEAAHLALSGKHDAAMVALADAIDLGWRDPLLGIEPAFADLHEDPVFQAQAARMIELINVERAKLDMEPLPE